MTMTDIHNLNVIRQWLDGFVDDTSLFANLNQFDNDDINETVNKLQKDTVIWADLLEASGGQLELSKCFYYVLSWKFDIEGNATPMTSEEINATSTPISLQDRVTKEQIFVDQKEVKEAHKTLGAWKTMMGCENKQILELRIKSDKFAAIVKSSNLSRKQARVSYSSIYVPSMAYCLAALNLPENKLDRIQCSAVDAFIPAMGYDHSFPRAIVYGPREFGGLNLCHLYTEQCIIKIGTFISHVRANTTLGRIMMLNLDWTQLYSGRGTPVLQSKDEISYIPDNWFIHFREFLLSVSGAIKIPNAWYPVRERVGDAVLMDEFQKIGLLPAQLRLVNNWRIFFKATLLSDITNAAGTMVQKVYRKRPKHNKIDSQRRYCGNFPRQAVPGPQGFSLWTKCIKQCFHMSSQGKLKSSLGDWLVNPSSSKSQWTFYVSTNTMLLYETTEEGFKAYTNIYSRKHTCRYNLSTTCMQILATLPDDCIPIDVYITESGIATINHMNIQIKKSNKALPTATTFDEYILLQPKWSQDLLDNWSSTEMCDILKEISISEKPLLLVSDGGLRDTQGSYGVVIGTNEEELIHNQGIARGAIELASSFRSESYGMLSGCHTLVAILNHYNIMIPKDKRLQLYTDSESLVKRLHKHLNKPLPLKSCGGADIDVECQIHACLQELVEKGFQISIHHVKGHQDDHILFEKLERQAQLNVVADKLATDAFDPRDLGEYLQFPASKLMLYINNRPITSKYKESLKSAYLSQGLRKHMITQFVWKDHIPDNIWWAIHGKGLKILSFNDRMRIQKFIHNRMATNYRQSKYCSYITDKCTMCSHSVEKEDHILKCLSPSRQGIREEWISSLRRFLMNDHTHPVVCIAIISGVQAWLDNKAPPKIHILIPNASTHLIKAYEQQTEIGWDHFVRGRLSIQWSYLCQHYLDQHNISSTKMTSDRWGRQLISINWESVLKLWERRNIEEHGDTTEEQNVITKNKLLLEAKNIQDANIAISYVDRDILYRPIDVLVQYTISNLLAWVRNARYIVNTHRLEERSDVRKRTRFRSNEGGFFPQGIG